jgi:20S proteasome subunit alpha 6
MFGSNQSHGRGGAPGQMGGGRGGPGGNRGGVGGGGRGGGRGGSMSGNRGGSTGGGRGGSMFLGPGGGAGRGGGGGGQVAPLRAHGSRGGFGNSKDYHNRRGGSFTSGGHSHQNMGNSFRGGRGQNHSSGRGGRHDGGGGGSSAFGARDGPMASSFSSSGKKDENRRTLTDFKIVGLEMRELGWTWGILPSQPPPLSSVMAEAKEDASEGPDTSQASVKHEATEAEVPLSSEKVDEVVDPENVANSSAEAASVESKSAANIATSIEVPTGPSKDAHAFVSTSAPSAVPPPPSRIRIYFHTPVSADDSHPISLNASSSFSMGMTMPSDSRKGKRKKLEEDDGDLEEEGRGKRPPPPMGSGSQISDNASVDMDAPGRGSVAPSVAETASEGDWLMAAIAQDDAEDAQNGDGNRDGDDDKLNVSHIEENNDTEVGEGDNVGKCLCILRCDMAYPTSCGRNASSREIPHKIPHR